MNPLHESTVNMLVSTLMGIVGGSLTIPINALFSWILKRDEQFLQHRLSKAAKQHELILQHKLELARKTNNDSELDKLRVEVKQLRQEIEKVARASK